MAQIEFPNSSASPFTDGNGQVWVWNGTYWTRQSSSQGIGEAPVDDNGYMRKNSAWETISVDTWYLGPLAGQPIYDNFGDPVTTGQIYFDTTRGEMRSFDGTSWRPFKTAVSTIVQGEYVWEITGSTHTGGTPLPWPDTYGNVEPNWVVNDTFVFVFVDGVFQVNESNPGALSGDYTVNYSTNTVTPTAGTDYTVGTVITVMESSAIEDFLAENVEYNNVTSGLTATDVQAALDEIDDTVDGIVTSIGTISTGFKNQIINGNRTINQREIVANYADLDDGDFGFDRWMRFDGTEMVQIIENNQLNELGTYTLSWTGGGTARVITATGTEITGTHPLTLIPVPNFGFNNVEIYLPFTARSIQLEVGSVATAYEVRNIQQEMAMCQRFFFTENFGTGAYGFLATADGTSRFFRKDFPVTMVGVPTIDATGTTTPASSIVTTNSAQLTLTAGAPTGTQRILTFTASAELYPNGWSGGGEFGGI